VGTGSGGSQVSSLVIRNFSIDGLVLGSNGNTIRDCYIGTDFFGTVKQANGNDGIRIDGSNNTIGGTTATPPNVISGNIRYGVHIDLTTAQGNQIQGNYIGTDNTGAADLGNGNSGIVVRGPFNTIGGNTAGARNIISGNDQFGVDIEGSLASNNFVQGNYIGTNAAGTAAIGNSFGGVLITDAPFNTIGGTTGTAGNLISGNSSVGLWLARSGHNVIQGNLIGTDKTGSLPLPNVSGVVVANSADNMIGGTITGARNVLSGNSSDGVQITGASATGNIGNGQNGVKIIGSPNVTVAQNIISGNGNDGVLVTGDGAISNKVQGNYIGTDAAGTVALGNAAAGVGLFTANNTVGGTTLQARNVISGNGREGVYITAIGNTVQGNFIGTNAAGTAALGNALDGVNMDGAPSTLVGGREPGAGNIISGNQGDGLTMSGAAASSNIIQGNFIGTDVSGTIALANSLQGVRLFNAKDNTIGGTAAGAGNLISGNNNIGVNISAATGNKVQGNFIGTNVSGK